MDSELLSKALTWGVISLGIGASLFAAHRKRTRLARLAEEVFDSIEARRKHEITGTMGGFGIALAYGDDEDPTELKIFARAPAEQSNGSDHEEAERARLLIPPSLRVQTHKPLLSIIKSAPRPDFVVGHPEFDNELVLAGDPFLLLALFDARTRDAALALARAFQGRVAGGSIEIRLDAKKLTSVKLRSAAQAGIALAKRLAIDDSQLERVFLGALEKKDLLSVQVRRLEAWSARHGEAAWALGLENPDLAVRARAAERIGVAAAPKLVQIVEDVAAPSGARIQALASLLRVAPEGVAPIALRLLEDRALRSAAAKALGELGHLEARRPILLAVATATPLELEAFAIALSGFEGDEVEHALGRIAEHGTEAASEAACQALAKRGTTRSIGALMSLMKREGRVGSAAREAVAAIRGRSGNAGGLSVALQTPEGGLSVSAGAGGLSVSSATKPPGDDEAGSGGRNG